MKHDNYDRVANIRLEKHKQRQYGYTYYTLNYGDYELYGTKEDIINELSEHMDNMEQ